MDRRFSRVQASHSHCGPRADTSSDHVTGRSSTVVPHRPQVSTLRVWPSRHRLVTRTARLPPYPPEVDETSVDEAVEVETAEVDPHYLELLRGSKLPQAYLPAAMAGPQKPWVRVFALVLIAVFFFATVSGICLTYGVGHGG